jgi:hypothetical protein
VRRTICGSGVGSGAGSAAAAAAAASSAAFVAFSSFSLAVLISFMKRKIENATMRKSNVV